MASDKRLIKQLREELAAANNELDELRQRGADNDEKLSPRQLMSKGIAEEEAKKKGGDNDGDQDE